MSNKPRGDRPGALFHVWNRGIAHRSVFEGRKDVRCFLARLARAVHDGLIDVIAFSFPLNHFHLLVRSRTGELGRVMQAVEAVFVRRFNQPRDRDGPLFKARYGSMKIESQRYLIIVIRYIDQNCVRGGLAVSPAEFEFGSAWHYAREKVPRWLSRSFIEELLGPRRLEGKSLREAYEAFFGQTLTPAEVELVRRRMIFQPDDPDPFDDLVGAALPRTRDWLVRQAELADGTRPGVVVLPPEALLAGLSEVEKEAGLAQVRLERNLVDTRPLLLAGLLRGLCGTTLAEVSLLAGVSRSRASEIAGRHQQLLLRDEEYRNQASRVVSRAFALAYPEGAP
jgi:hypothetical protein